MKLIPGLTLLLAAGLWLPAQTAPRRPIDLSPRAGLRFAYFDAACWVGAGKQANHLRAALATAQLTVEPLESLTVSLQAGYNLAYAATALDFTTLPLPLRIDRDKFQGLVLGAGFSVGPLVSGDFEFLGVLDLLLVREANRAWAVPLQPQPGTALAGSRFHLLSIDGLVRYQALTGVVPYAGLRLGLLGGRFRAAESAPGLAAEELLSFRQRRVAGVVAGVAVEVGDNWEVTVEANLINRTALTLTFDYVF